MSQRSDERLNLTMQFPEGFHWGAATSAYQIEGAAREDGKGESIWDTFSHTPGKTDNGDTGDVACDHYHRYKDDIALLQELGVNAYRFSIAWPRIFPTGSGQVNVAGLDYYDRLVDTLLTAGIDPWLTLYHWDLPQALQDRGGWADRDTVERFAGFADTMARRLGDRVSNWITINEPWVISFLGHMLGIHAPGHRDQAEYLQVAHNLLLAHGTALDPIRTAVPGARVGISLNLSQVYPDTESDADAEAARHADGSLNRWFLDPLYRRCYPEDMVTLFGDAMPAIDDRDFGIIAGKTDFLGINTYSPFYVKSDPSDPTGLTFADREGEHMSTGWLVEPEALTDLLSRVHDQYNPPEIVITENGAAFDDRLEEGRVRDRRRTACIHDHILAACRAIDQDVPLTGYFAWSLLDNFEWNSGYSIRFGIIHVDYTTQERTIKDSGRWFGDVCRSNALVPIEDQAPGPSL